MTKLERKLVLYIERNMNIIFVIFISIVGVLIRFPLRKVLTSDMTAYYIPWHDYFKSHGGVLAMTKHVSDYGSLYELFFAIISYLPGSALIKVKGLSIVFDFVMAFGVYFLTLEIAKEYYKDELIIAKRKAIVAYTITILSLVVVLNSAAWGQCDQMYTSMIIWSIYYYIKGKYNTSFFFLGLSFCLKLQAVFIIPFYLFMYIYEKKVSILHFLEIPIMIFLSEIPHFIACLVCNRLDSLGDTAVHRYFFLPNGAGRLYMEYPSFWAFLPDTDGSVYEDYNRFKSCAILITICVIGIMCYQIYNRNIQMTKTKIVELAMIMTFIAVYFLPNMMTRYGFIYEILAIVVACVIPKTFLFMIPMKLIILYLYAGKIGQETLPISIQTCSWVYLGVLMGYIYLVLTPSKK